MFDDLLRANASYQKDYGLGHLSAQAQKHVAVLTCMDTRIDPLGMLGLTPGDAKIVRNAGARVSDDALRSLILATNLLSCERVAIVQHTDCAMSKNSDQQLRDAVTAKSGADASGIDFLAVPDQKKTLREDVEKVRRCPQIGAKVIVAGFIYDVHTGALELVVS
jgi:carbonic anhydrase